MNRREFIKSHLLTGFLQCATDLKEVFAQWAGYTINTVGGAISPERLGLTLIHEHVLVDFIGADKVQRDRYNAKEVFRIALPYLKRIHELGGRALVECTPAYLGRDPALLKKLSKASGIHILTNTGYYGAGDDKFIPHHAYDDSIEQLARRWIQEFNYGIEGTGIKPGIIKIGVDKGPLSEIDAKLVRAAALTHLKTGLIIASHTSDSTAALEEISLLNREGVDASAFIWVHAQNEKDHAKHIKAAEQGSWIEFDSISDQTLDRHVELVKRMVDRGLISRTLISQDAGWYHAGEPGGGKFRNYEFLFTHFIPALKKSGIREDQIRKLLIDNPREALTPKIRPLSPIKN